MLGSSYHPPLHLVGLRQAMTNHLCLFPWKVYRVAQKSAVSWWHFPAQDCSWGLCASFILEQNYFQIIFKLLVCIPVNAYIIQWWIIEIEWKLKELLSPCPSSCWNINCKHRYGSAFFSLSLSFPFFSGVCVSFFGSVLLSFRNVFVNVEVVNYIDPPWNKLFLEQEPCLISMVITCGA